MKLTRKRRAPAKPKPPDVPMVAYGSLPWEEEAIDVVIGGAHIVRGPGGSLVAFRLPRKDGG